MKNDAILHLIATKNRPFYGKIDVTRILPRQKF